MDITQFEYDIRNIGANLDRKNDRIAKLEAVLRQIVSEYENTYDADCDGDVWTGAASIPADVELLLKRIERLRMLADAYRRVSAKHESMVGDLRDALNADDLDKARDIVSAEYDAIHGPNG
jgi:hypothetical protein